MWTRLQRFKAQVVAATALFAAHSFLCIALYRVSLRKLEFGVLWEHMYRTDLPVSLFLEPFFDAYSMLFNRALQGTYHAPYFWFHLVFGGLQFFLWGWLLGALAKWLMQRRRSAETG
jgi:hypothetical protein